MRGVSRDICQRSQLRTTGARPRQQSTRYEACRQNGLAGLRCNKEADTLAKRPDERRPAKDVSGVRADLYLAARADVLNGRFVGPYQGFEAPRCPAGDTLESSVS